MLSWDKTPGDQAALDAADKLALGRTVTAFRPGYLVRVVGVLRGGHHGLEVIGKALNVRAVTAAEGDDAVLVSTSEYGRLWFRMRGSAFRCLGRARE